MSNNPASAASSYKLSCTSPSPGPFMSPTTVTPAPATPAADGAPSSSSTNCHRKKILILYTGGTMGMRPSAADGSLAPEAGYLTERIKELPELCRPEMPLYEIIEYDPLMDSSCMTPTDWIKIAKDIETHYDEFDGFVVIMGTDTMAYASSALSFMLENLTKPVVFTGSQIPFYEVYNDARRNFLVSVIFAAIGAFNEVCICFNDRLLRANRAVKINSTSLLAFDSPNYPPLATLGAFINENRDLALPPPMGFFRVHKTLQAKVIVLKLVPGFDGECIRALVLYTEHLKGIILEMYGTGNGPSNSTLIDAIRLAKEKGIVVVATSQCLHGGVSLDHYSMGLDFRNAGVVSAGDMTTEACSTKLAYLFGTLEDPKQVEKWICKNIRGEMSSVPIHRKFFNDLPAIPSVRVNSTASVSNNNASNPLPTIVASSSSSSLTSRSSFVALTGLGEINIGGDGTI